MFTLTKYFSALMSSFLNQTMKNKQNVFNYRKQPVSTINLLYSLHCLLYSNSSWNCCKLQTAGWFNSSGIRHIQIVINLENGQLWLASVVRYTFSLVDALFKYSGLVLFTCFYKDAKAIIFRNEQSMQDSHLLSGYLVTRFYK